MKKIILSTYTFQPDIGGVASNTLSIAEAFIAQGFDVTVVTLTNEHWDGNDKINIIRNPSPLQLVKLYWHADWVLFSNLSAKLCWPATFMNKVFALHHHSSSAFSRPAAKGIGSYIKRYIEDKVIAKSIHFVNSEFTKKDAGVFFDNLPTYITYPILKNTTVPEHIVDQYTERKNAVFVGRIEIEKGVSYLLDNIETIKEILDIDKLTFVGSGALLTSLQEKNISGANFIGAVDLTQVHSLMEKSEYVFVPSIWQEPFGMVAVEGLSSGAVVISSDRGGLPEAVGDVGELFDLSSLTSFKDALKRAKTKRNAYLNRRTLLTHIDSVNGHMDQFSSSKVINVIINGLKDADNKGPK